VTARGKYRTDRWVVKPTGLASNALSRGVEAIFTTPAWEHSPTPRRRDPTAVSHSKSTPSPSAARSLLGARIVDNAFRVLGLTPRASWPDVARTAEALLAALEAGDPTAATYDSPLGPRPRTTGAILVARARLRDPDERIQQEIWWEAPRRGPWEHVSLAWAGGPAGAPAWPHARTGSDGAEPWPHAPAAWGWRSR
jgi:hypothetical protein